MQGGVAIPLEVAAPPSPVGSGAPARTPPSSSKRRAKLQSDLEAGALFADGLGSSEAAAAGGFLGACSSDSEFVPLSSGEGDGEASSSAHTVQAQDLFSRTSSCVYDKVDAVPGPRPDLHLLSRLAWQHLSDHGLPAGEGAGAGANIHRA
jgi:hypothetical protein